MATVVNFNGKKCIEPGSYAATVYSPTSVVNVAEFGNVMIIDDGLASDSVNGYEFAGGAGIMGELADGLKAVYEFDSLEDFRAFMGGGLVTDIATQIFTPGNGNAGAPKLYYVRAAQTTCATMTLQIAAASGDDPAVTLVLKCKNEGVVGNGVLVSNVLKVGYSAKIIAGSETNTFKLQVYRGTFQGVDAYGEAFGPKTLAEAQPELIAESEDFTTLAQLYDWCMNSREMLAHFQISTTGDTSTSLVAVAQVLAAGGTTDYTANGAYDAVLESIEELDVTFFLCTNLNAKNGAGVNAATNGKLFTFLKQQAKFTEFMVVPGGADDTDLFGASNTSESIAKYFNSGQVVTIHGAPIVTRKDNNGTKQLEPIYLAANVIGLNAGLAPQEPITFKRVGYNAFAYDLKKKEREKALQAGVMHTRNVSGYYCVNQGVTTLQNNLQTIAPDGQSLELSIELIKAQLNKELILEGQTRFTGKTAAQASPESVKNFTETKLASFVAYPGNDNLLISWKNVKVVANNGDYFVYYDFVPNVPVNKTFFVGNILDFSF